MSEEPFLVTVLEAGCLWDCGSTHGRSKRFFCSLKHFKKSWMWAFSDIICYVCCVAGLEFSSFVEDKSKDVFAIYEDTLHKSSPPAVILSGPELASMMKIGTRVVRGVDWKWGDQVSILFYFLLSKGQNTNCGHMRGVSIW